MSAPAALWYPNDIVDTTAISACTFRRDFGEKITIDDIVDGHLCHFDKETGDLCLSEAQQTVFLGTFPNRTYIEEVAQMSTPNLIHTTLIPYVNVSTVIPERAPHNIGSESPFLNDLARLKYAGSLVARGDKVTDSGMQGSDKDFDHFNDVKEIDLRGLRSSCACLKANIDGTDIEVDMYDDIDKYDWPTVHTDLAFEIDLRYFGSVRKVDLSDLKFTESLELKDFPRAEVVNLDGLQHVRDLELEKFYSLRSLYLPNLKKAHKVELSNNNNLMDFVAPKWNNVDNRWNQPVFDLDNQKNLHAIVVGCLFGENGVMDDITESPSPSPAPSPSPNDFGTNVEDTRAGINWDYLVNAHNNGVVSQDLTTEIGKVRAAAGDRAGDLTWEQIVMGPAEKDNDAWAALGGFNETSGKHEDNYKFDFDAASHPTNSNDLIAPGFVNYCGEETFQYDRLFDFGAGLEFRMNVRCDLNRNQEELALGHKYAAVIELENAPAHKQVLLAWNRNSGEAVWQPSAKCSQKSDLRGIDEKNGQMSRGRADGNGYVKFRQYLEKCDTYVYQAIADPQSEDCSISKMVYGQANRGDALIAGTTDLRARGRGGQDKLDLRAFL